MIKAILLLGGKGERFGSDKPKQFHKISGKQIYLLTLERFLESALFDEIILVCNSMWVEEVKKDLLAYPEAAIRVTAGGKTRQESSFLGLKACGAETAYVVIHDAVRPFVSLETLKNNVEQVQIFGAVDTCIPSTDTLVFAPEGTAIDSIPNRSHYLRGQTPQSFSYPLILQAHQTTALTNASDDCIIALSSQNKVHVVLGAESNIKITTELDLFLAEQLFSHFMQVKQRPSEGSLSGKVFAVTGGSGGIGAQICSLLQEEGATPLSISRSSAHFPADLSSAEETEKVFQKIHQKYGALDGLINSIGLFHRKPLSELSYKEIEETIDANLKAIIFCCKAASIKSQGSIINIASSAYSHGRHGHTVYAAAKAAVVNFTQGLAEERTDLFINSLAPQRTDTVMRQNSFPQEDPKERLTPKAVAREVLQLLKLNNLTGSTIQVRKDLIHQV